jgi:hypothetical protein
MDWEDMVKIEPALARLLKDVEAADRHGIRAFCGVTAWHGSGGRLGLKMRMYQLAGFGSSNAGLRTREAYEVALEKLYNALPPCRGCACVEEEELRCA